MELYNKAVNLIKNSSGQNGIKDLKLLLEIPLAVNQFTVNLKNDSDGNTLLHVAAMKGDINIIEYLLKHNTYLTIKNRDGFYPLQLAIINNHFNATKYLLRFIKNTVNNLSVQRILINESLLFLLVIYAKAQSDNKKSTLNISFLKLLLQFNADVNLFAQLSTKTRLIHIAARFNNSDSFVLYSLIEAGANINAFDNVNDTPLHIAAKNFLYSHIAILLPKGDVNLQNKNKDTPLHCLIKGLIQQKDLTIKEILLGQLYVKQLVDAGTSLLAVNKQKQTFLDLYKHHEKILLLSNNKLYYLVNYFKQLFIQKAHLELATDYKKLFIANNKEASSFISSSLLSQYNYLKTSLELKKFISYPWKNKTLKQNRYQFFQIDIPMVNTLIKKAGENTDMSPTLSDMFGFCNPNIAL